MDARLPVKPQRGKSYRILKSSSPIMLKLRAFNMYEKEGVLICIR